MPKAPEMGAMPSAWTHYFVVSEHDAAAGRAEGAGGKGPMPAMTMPGVGRFWWLMAPQGAVFSIRQPEQEG